MSKWKSLIMNLVTFLVKDLLEQKKKKKTIKFIYTCDENEK